MEVETEAWRVHLNPKTWLSGKHARGDGNPVEKKRDKTPARRVSALTSTNFQDPEEPKVRAVPLETKDAAREPKPKREKPITLCFHNKKKKFPCPVPCKEREPSLGSLTASCNANCCRLCAIISKYLQDVLRCVYCLVNCSWPNTCFCQLARQLASAAFGVCTDCVYIIRHILNCLVGVKK